MREMLSLQRINSILRSYQIEPRFVEQMGKVQKIYSNKGVYVLKKIDPHHGIDFIKYVQTLYQKGYNRIVPIYPTVDGRYAVLDNQELYYLMPWLPDEEKEGRSERQQQLFRELARLHSISAKEIKVNKEERTRHFERMITDLDQEEEFLLSLLEVCERKVYMSPFELMYCMYYHDFNQALFFSKKRLEEWYEKTKDQEKVRVVVVHGKLSSDHFLYDDRGYGYFINFEKATIGPPTHDLLPFLAKTLRNWPKQYEDLVEWLYTYYKYFPFKEEEMQLFLSYIAHPGAAIKTAERFYKEGYNRNELKAVQKLQRDYWQLKNTEYLVMRIDEIERQKKQEEAARNEQ
nr:spore coat protein YsxE [uncultured Bacillus sp.]